MLESIISEISISSRTFFIEWILCKFETSIFSDRRYFIANSAPNVFMYALFFTSFCVKELAAALASYFSLSSM